MSRLAAFVIPAVLAGCGGGSDRSGVDPPPPPGFGSDTGCLGDDCGDSRYFDVASIYIRGQFGYDATSRRTVTVDVAGLYTVPPAYEIYLALDGWSRDVSDTDSYCYIHLPFDAAGSSPSLSTRLYARVEYDSVAQPPVTNCNTEGYELDPQIWGTDVIDLFVTTNPGAYFMAPGDPIDQIERDVIPLLPEELQPLAIGGTMGVPSFMGTEVDVIYGFAWRLDDIMRAELDDTGYLQGVNAQEVALPDNMVTAWYNLVALLYWPVQ